MSVEQVVGSVPSDWEYTTLGEACARGGGEVQTGPFGSQLHAADYVRDGVPSIMPQNIGDNRVVQNGIARITPNDAERLGRYLVRPGDIVYSRRGDVERRALIRKEEDGWLCGTGCLRVRFGDAYIDPLYASYYLGDARVREWIVRHAHGATMPNLNTAILSALPFVSPPLPEQRAIAHILGTLDDKIELSRMINETLKAMAQALFKSWFVDFDPVHAKAAGRDAGLPEVLAGRFPSSFDQSPFGPIPQGWRVKPLSELCTLGRGASPRPINDFMNGEVPWVKIADATAAGGPFLFETKEKLKQAGTDKSVPVAPGDLILSNSATCGVPVFVELHGCIHDGWLYFKNLRSISKLYLYHVLIGLADHLVHIADGSVQKNLNTNLVGQQNVLLPTPQVLEAFDRQASGWFAKMRQNGLMSRNLASLRDTLLPKLISGEVRIEDAGRIIARHN
jgi:type I restriction enzyme S subunit